MVIRALLFALLLCMPLLALGQGASNLGGFNIKKGPCGEGLKIAKDKCQIPLGGGSGVVGPPAPGAGRGGDGLTLAGGTTSMDFPGQGNRSRCEGPTDTALGLTAPIGDVSVCLWYKVDTALSQFNGPFGSATNSSYLNGFGLYRDTSDSTVRMHVGQFNISGFTATFTNMWTVDGNWHHLCGTHDSVNRQVTIWFDGTASQSGVNATAVTRNLGSNQTWGAAHDESSTFGDFEGRVDIGAVWVGTILTQADVDDLYNSGSPTDPSTIVAGPDYWYQFGDDASDDDTPTTGQVTDQTVNANHCTPLASGTAAVFVTDTP